MKIISAKPEWTRTLQPGYCGFITREHDFVGDGIEYFEHFETGLPFVHTFIVEGPAPAAGANDFSFTRSRSESEQNLSSEASRIENPNGVPSFSPGLPRGCVATLGNKAQVPAAICEAARSSGRSKAKTDSANQICGPSEDKPVSTCNIIEAHAGAGVARATLQQYLGQKNVQCFIRIPIGYTEKIGANIVSAASAHLGEKYGFGLILADALANTVAGHWLNRLTRSIPDKFLCWLLDNQHTKICSQLVALALQAQFYLRLRGCLRRPADTILPKELGNDPQIWDPVIYKIQN